MNWRLLLLTDMVVLAALVAWIGMVVRLAGPMPMTADPVTGLLGFPLPAEPTVARMIGNPLPDLYFLTLTLLGLGAYLAGVRRLRHNGHRWPVTRTAFWCAGILILAAVTNLGVSRYSYVLFSAHMAQHMVLSMLVPVLLVSGAPATLALRALHRPTEAGVWGPRDWLLAALHSRTLRVLTHPVVAAGIYLGSLYGLYFTPLLGTLMRYHIGHLVMLTHFVAAGYLFFWVLIGVDPGRRRVPHVVLILVHFIVIAAHAIFGVVIMQARTLYTGTWFTIVHPPWAATPVHDQSTGGAIAWAFGEIPAVIVFGILIVQWIREDEREQRRIDRAADRAEAQGREDEALAAYNAFLAAANRQAGGTRR
jgi:putative copper resistance protein D